MNVFMPEKSICASVKALDDSRLRKQILECKQIYALITNPKNPKSPYLNHAVVKHYKDFPSIIIMYGFACVLEFKFRFCKEHAYHEFFTNLLLKLDEDLNKSGSDEYELEQSFKDSFIYAENQDKTQIREYSQERVNELFRQKLCKKWLSDKRKTTWTRCEPPEFLRNYVYCPEQREAASIFERIVEYNELRNARLEDSLL